MGFGAPKSGHSDIQDKDRRRTCKLAGGKAAARLHGWGCNDAPDQCGRTFSVDMAPKILGVPTCGEWKGLQICSPPFAFFLRYLVEGVSKSLTPAAKGSEISSPLAFIG